MAETLAAPLEKAVSQAEQALQNWRDSPLTGMAHVPQATRDDAALLYNALVALLATLDADKRLEKAEMVLRQVEFEPDAEAARTVAHDYFAEKGERL